jgi:purine nucleoside phosphorylase
MRRVALIGGTGAAALLAGRAAERVAAPATPWGAPSGDLQRWRQGATEVWYLPRHGEHAAIAPHRVNYRANVWALRSLEPDAVIGINAVGGITPAAAPGRVVLPAQLIDYTWGRAHTFCDGEREPLRHVEFDPPFCEALRAALAAAAGAAGLDALAGGTYGCTQGPRLETAAEIDRLAADGCDVVGMTAMPEAALAREAGLDYAVCACVVNRAAGRLPAGASIHGDLAAHLGRAIDAVGRLLDGLLAGA